MSIVVALRLKDRHVCIVGGGPVAERKAKQLQQEGAIIQLIAPNITLALQAMQGITWIQEPFDWSLVHKDCFYLYAATNDPMLNETILLNAKQRNLLCGSCMQSPQASIQSMYASETEHVQFAISTHGACPGADRAIMERYLLPQLPDIDQLVAALSRLRTALLQMKLERTQITTVLQTLAQWDVSYTKELLHVIHQKQRVVLLAYHGIAEVKKEMMVFTQMEQRVKAQKVSCMTAFFSTKILKKAHKKGYGVASLSELEHILHICAVPTILQPMLLQQGSMLNTCLSCVSSSMRGGPLVEQEQDIDLIYRQCKTLYACPLLFLYHPNEHAHMQAHTLEQDHFCSIDDASIVSALPKRLCVIPLFLLYGYHVQKDIEQQWMPMLWKQGIDAKLMTGGLLQYDVIQELFLNKMKALISHANKIESAHGCQ